ncbi:MAG TPA: dihydroorotate dehydrogenase [Nitrososphaerales archaeon]|nr:dihydroorotate dehydrogenase [Nitrososphaerales archaeon]
MDPEAIRVDAGKLHLSNPTVLASGVQGPSLSRVLEALKYGAGAAVTKSVGPKPRDGYPEPTMVEVDSGMVNAAGLPNPGGARFSEELSVIQGKSLPVIVSIFGGGDTEFESVVDALDNHDFEAYELNLSCPHVEGVGTEVGHHPEVVYRVVKAVKSATSKPVFAKLSPNTERLLEVAGAALEAGADGLTATNTVRAISIDVETGRPALSNVYGGLSGGAIRPIALRCVYELREKFDVPIMGCGGVSKWEDAVQFFLAGADAVQVGTSTLQRLDRFNDINVGVLGYMERKGIRALKDLVGRAHQSGKGSARSGGGLGV